MGGRAYVLGKVFQAFLTLVLILIFNFFLFRIIPADPVKLLVRSSGHNMTEAQQDRLRHDLGLDLPVFPGQFIAYLKDTSRLNLGQSLFVSPGESVSSVFFRNLWPTLLLVGTSTIASTALGIWMGIYGGWRRGGFGDVSFMGSSLVLYAIPEFVLGILFLLLFGTALGWFPTGGFQSATGDYTGLAHVTDVLNHMFLPWLTLTLAYVGEFYLIMRSSLLDVLGEDYITLARAKGLREKVVLNKHAVRNALLPTVTLIALSFAFVLGGAITVETVFSYPGVGYLELEAIRSKDFPLLEGLFLFFAAAVIVANLVADLLYGYLDPRVRTA
ncbi:MAG TPA: ABC transporter permease [Actinomycetota bacterium]|nr:ABC transporter permease [Actinomycetota bacterium]